MKKKTLRFAYWINETIPPDNPIWTACYYLPIERCGLTQIGGAAAIERGYRLDPKTPSLAEWKKKRKIC